MSARFKDTLSKALPGIWCVSQRLSHRSFKAVRSPSIYELRGQRVEEVPETSRPGEKSST
jgi:hypothetical protein